MNSHWLDTIGGEMEAMIRTVHELQIPVTCAGANSLELLLCFSLAQGCFLSSYDITYEATGTLICASR
jgi:hypothetical protein